MKVFKLHVDCAACDWIGVAMVAAESYDAAVSEYADNGESGRFVKSGEIVLTDDRDPVEGLSFDGTKILFDVITFNA